MTTLRSRFLIPTLLAGAAALAGCSDKDPGASDLAGMTDSIAAACPSMNATTQDKLNCANLAKQHSIDLLTYLGANENLKMNDHFLKACTFKQVPSSVPAFARPQIVGSQASQCLTAVENATTNAVVKVTAREIKNAMSVGLTQ